MQLDGPHFLEMSRCPERRRSNVRPGLDEMAQVQSAADFQDQPFGNPWVDRAHVRPLLAPRQNSTTCPPGGPMQRSSGPFAGQFAGPAFGNTAASVQFYRYHRSIGTGRGQSLEAIRKSYETDVEAARTTGATVMEGSALGIYFPRVEWTTAENGLQGSIDASLDRRLKQPSARNAQPVPCIDRDAPCRDGMSDRRHHGPEGVRQQRVQGSAGAPAPEHIVAEEQDHHRGAVAVEIAQAVAQISRRPFADGAQLGGPAEHGAKERESKFRARNRVR